MGKKINKKPSLSSLPPESFKFQLPRSQYSIKYATYLQKQFSSVQILIKKIVKQPNFSYYYLRFPLQGLLKGVCKKLMMNTMEVTIYGYFLSICQWQLEDQIFGNLYQLFPDIMHVNEPVDTEKLKQLSMFLFFSSYSVKDFLNPSPAMQMYLTQMTKIFPQFSQLQPHWVERQPTTSWILNPKVLNTFFKQIHTNNNFVDYNITIDKIIQISPCYDINPKTEKQKKVSQVYSTNYHGANHQKKQVEERQQVKNEFVSEEFEDFRIINQII